MNRISLCSLAVIASLGLTACGSSTDASEDAIADTVEMPADEAMADTPEPVEDPDALVDPVEAATADAEESMDALEDQANEAAEDAEEAVE